MINSKDCRLKFFCAFLAGSFPIVAGCGNVRVNAPISPISASASPLGETKSNRQPLSSIFPFYSDYSEPSPLPTVKKHLKVSKLVRELTSGASGQYRNLSLLVDGEPNIVHLTCEPERHPSDMSKSRTEARFRYKISIDESSFTSDPASMLEEYYRRIDDGDEKGAFTLRSSSATTSYAEFKETWKSNRNLELRHPSVSSDSTVDCELVSDDFDPESNQVNRRVFRCKIKVTKELGEWRYAGGDFHQVSCVAIKADATADVPSEPAPPQGWGEFRSSDGKLKIALPPGWVVSDSLNAEQKDLMAKLAKLNPSLPSDDSHSYFKAIDTKAENNIYDSLNVKRVPITEAGTPPFNEESIKLLRTGFAKSSSVDESEIEVDVTQVPLGKAFHYQLPMRFSLSQDSTLSVHSIGYMLFQGNYGYILTFTTRPENKSNFADKAKTMMENLTITQ